MASSGSKKLPVPFQLLILFPGNHNKEATPVPIPNTEVKLFSADGTAPGAEWESRSLPGFFLEMPCNLI